MTAIPQEIKDQMRNIADEYFEKQDTQRQTVQRYEGFCDGEYAAYSLAEQTIKELQEENALLKLELKSCHQALHEMHNMDNLTP